MEIYVLICLILFFAAFAHGLSGFASILVAVPLLAIFIDIKIVIPLVALSSLSITMVLLIQLRHHLNWKKIIQLLVGAVPGVPVGVFLLKRLDQETIQLTLGIILIGYALYTLISKQSEKGIREGWAYAFGFLSGCLSGALSSPGPPVVAYVSLQNWDKDLLKGSLQGCWFIIFSIVVILHASSGVTTLPVLRFYGCALPVLLIGTYLGSLFYGRISENHYRKLMLILLGLLGALMIYRA